MGILLEVFPETALNHLYLTLLTSQTTSLFITIWVFLGGWAWLAPWLLEIYTVNNHKIWFIGRASNIHVIISYSRAFKFFFSSKLGSWWKGSSCVEIKRKWKLDFLCKWFSLRRIDKDENVGRVQKVCVSYLIQLMSMCSKEISGSDHSLWNSKLSILRVINLFRKNVCKQFDLRCI